MVKTEDEIKQISRNGEIARFTTYIIERFAKLDENKIAKQVVRDDVCREMKALRVKLQCKEKEVFPPALLERCLKVLWDQ